MAKKRGMQGGAGVALMFALVQTAYAVECSTDPLRGLDAPPSWAVKLEPDLLDKIVEACDPVSGFVDGLTQLTLGTQEDDKTSLSSVGKSGKELLEFVQTAATVAGGLEAHLLKCTGDAAWGMLLDQVPPVLVNAQKAHDELSEKQDGIAKQLLKLKDKQRRNLPLTLLEQREALGAVEDFVASAQSAVGPLGALLSAASTAVSDPLALLRSDEAQLEAVASQARGSIDSLERSCRVDQASSDLGAFVLLGQQYVTAAGLAEARLRKVLSQPLMEEIRVVRQRELQKAESAHKALRATLAQAGALCGQLKAKASRVEQRRLPFAAMLTRGQQAVADCRLEEVKGIVTSLANLEGTECGAYLTQGLMSDPPPPKNNLLGPTDASASATFSIPRPLIPPSAALRIASDNARSACAGAQKPATPPPPRVQGPVPPGPADFELVRGTPQVPPTDVVWHVVSDGQIKYKLYDGDYVLLGEYSWNPPGNIGPQGVSITLNVTCTTGKNNRFATGIGLAADNLDIIVDGQRVSRAEVPANCDLGQSQGGSVTALVMPRSGYGEGSTAEIRVGPFWAGSVKYPYTAKKVR